MLKQIALNVNSHLSSNNNLIPSEDILKIRLTNLCWNILYEIYLITLTQKRDYCFTAQEISDRFKAKGRAFVCRANIEAAIRILRELGFIRNTTKKYPTLWGKEKYKGVYREVTEQGLAFITHKLEDRTKNKNRDLNRDLKPSQPYCHVASEATSRSNLKINRSNLDLSIIVSSRERFDLANASFEEYAATMSNAPAYVEQEAIREEIYEPVLPKHRPTVKKLLDESGLKNYSKAEVIKAVVRQQNASTEIKSISAVTKKFIADERVRTKTYQIPIKQTYQFLDMTQEDFEKVRPAMKNAFAEMRKILRGN